MSDKTFKLTLVTPERTILDGVEATEVNVPGIEGVFHVLPGHEPFLTALSSSDPKEDPPKFFQLWYRNPAGERIDFTVDEGFIEVLPDKVSVLAGFACPESEMTKAEFEESERLKQEEITKRLEETKKKDEKDMTQKDIEDRRIEISELELQLQKSMSRVQFSQRKKNVIKK
jgi:F-type H+-transporting ATPase subunit epsilon